MTEKTENTEVVKFNNKFYKESSITDYARQITDDLVKVDSLIEQQTLALSVSNLGKGKLIEELQKEAEKFEEVPEPE